MIAQKIGPGCYLIDPFWVGDTRFGRVCWIKMKSETDFAIARVYEGAIDTAGFPVNRDKSFTSKYATGEIFKGEFDPEKNDYKGIVFLTNGAAFKGQWKDGVRTGYGEFFHRNGDYFSGEYVLDERKGQGTYTSKTFTYTGSWVNGKATGFGEMTSLRSRASYTGEFRDFKRHGLGVMIRPDGTKLEGLWEEGKLVKAFQVDINKLKMSSATQELPK